MSMSAFNLDRFRYDNKSTTTTNKEQSCFSRSPDSEKENEPGKQMLKAVLLKQWWQPDVAVEVSRTQAVIVCTKLFLDHECSEIVQNQCCNIKLSSKVFFRRLILVMTTFLC